MPKHLRRKHRNNNAPSSKKRDQEERAVQLIDTSEDEHGSRKTDLILEALRAQRLELIIHNDELRLLGLQDGGFLLDNSVRRKCWFRLLRLPEKKGAEDENVKEVNLK